jgi:hypothetical protein
VRRLLEGARDELVPQPLEATPDAPVDQAVTDSYDETSQQAGVDLDIERDAAAGGLLEPRGEFPDLVLGELGRGCGGGVGDALTPVVESRRTRFAACSETWSTSSWPSAIARRSIGIAGLASTSRDR